MWGVNMRIIPASVGSICLQLSANSHNELWLHLHSELLNMPSVCLVIQSLCSGEHIQKKPHSVHWMAVHAPT